MGFTKQFGDFSTMTIPKLSIPDIQLPSIPILVQAESTFRAQMKKMIASIPNGIPGPRIADMSAQLNNFYKKTKFPSIPLARFPSMSSISSIGAIWVCYYNQ
jgi:hypothetical protein